MGSESTLYVNKHGELCQRLNSEYNPKLQKLVLGFSCQDWTEKPTYSHIDIRDFIKPFAKPVIR